MASVKFFLFAVLAVAALVSTVSAAYVDSLYVDVPSLRQEEAADKIPVDHKSLRSEPPPAFILLA